MYSITMKGQKSELPTDSYDYLLPSQCINGKCIQETNNLYHIKIKSANIA